MLDDDEAALNFHLDLHPGDAVARLALSDWYEENGRMPEAEGQRYLARAKKYPMYVPFEEGYWCWFRPRCHYKGWRNKPPRHACLRHWQTHAMRGGPGADYPTRRDAEADLIRAVREAARPL